MNNGTWILVPPLSNQKFMYRVKEKHDGTLDKRKFQRVAQNFTQTHGVDYFDTFNPIIKTCHH